MEQEQSANITDANAGYVALRHGGAAPWRAAAELRLDKLGAARLEALFQVRRGGTTEDPMRPRYAKHGRHVAAVMAAGGYPVLAERRR